MSYNDNRLLLLFSKSKNKEHKDGLFLNTIAVVNIHEKIEDIVEIVDVPEICMYVFYREELLNDLNTVLNRTLVDFDFYDTVIKSDNVVLKTLSKLVFEQNSNNKLNGVICDVMK
jgi:hypothetical protein